MIHLVTTNSDGSVAHLAGTGQRELYYVYDTNGNNARETVKLADNATILSQTITTDFGQVVAQAQPNANGGFIYSRNEYNALGQLTKQYQDTGWNTAKTAATLYEYDAFGNVVKQTLVLASSPTPQNSPITEMAYGAEALTDGIYRTVSRTHYNAEGNPLVSVQKSLVSNLSDTLESKNLTIDERNLTSTQWVEYYNGTKRKSYNTLPTSNITAEAVTVDGFTLSQTDNAGVTTTAGRSYTANGMIQTRTDGRGNTTTTVTDTAGRTLTVTDAAGNATTTAYDSAHDLPAKVTDAQGNTSCYRYDVRGRKVAEWGTGLQPVLFVYDDADRMTTLTTFRAGTETISTDPSERTDKDVTTWTYHDTSGMEIRKSYADGSSITKTYDAENRPVSFTNAETNTVIECAYDHMGRRASKKVTVDGEATLHQRYLYRGYLQIACCDLTRSNHPCLWLITWDPSQTVATRPLAIQKDGTWYTYGWDLTKNICEVYGQHGYIRTNYTYTPYGEVSISGDVTQPIQWSSEFHDTELALVYYNYRHYNPTVGRWLGRDSLEELESINLYRFVNNKLYITDYLGNTDFYQTCTNVLREEYDNFVLEHVEALKNKFNEQTWELVVEDLKKWLNGEQPSSSTYTESYPRTQVIMNSYIGDRLRELFMNNNKNAKLCNEWRGMTNISIKLPNMFTVFNLALSTIFLKDPFIGLTEQSKLEIKRFIISILKGSTAFVGSVSANIYVTKQKDGNKDYILATYHVYNTVSKQSYYLRQPDFITDFIFNSNLKNWEQHYYWTEKHDCVDIFVECIDPCIYMHMAPGNPFSSLI